MIVPLSLTRSFQAFSGFHSSSQCEGKTWKSMAGIPLKQLRQKLNISLLLIFHRWEFRHTAPPNCRGSGEMWPWVDGSSLHHSSSSRMVKPSRPWRWRGFSGRYALSYIFLALGFALWETPCLWLSTNTQQGVEIHLPWALIWAGTVMDISSPGLQICW